MFLFFGENEYKGKKVEGNMSNYSSPPSGPKHGTRKRVAHAKCTFKKHLKADGSVNYAESNFHAITFRPLNGVTSYHIKAMFNQYKLDLIGLAGAPPLAPAGSFGVEGEGENRHVHVSLILRDIAKTAATKKRYMSAFNEGTLDMTVNKAGVKVCKELVVCQPACNKMENYSALAWLAYSVKNAGAGRQSVEEFTESDFNIPKGPRQVNGLFEGLTDDERETAVSQFKHKILACWKRKRANCVTVIAFSNVEKLATEFSAQHCPELPYTIDNAPELIARMVMHKGEVSYRFGQRFFAQRHALKRLQLSKSMDNYHDLIVGEVTETFQRVLNRNMPTTTASITIKTLREELKELKHKWTVKTHGKKCAHCRRFNRGVSRKDEYEDIRIMWNLQEENSDLKNDKDLLSRENSYLEKKLKEINDGAKREYKEDGKRPQKRRRVARKDHECFHCVDAPDSDREDCGKDEKGHYQYDYQWVN
jgi:hypothetical protein